MILEDPQPPTLDALQFDARTRLLPISLLFHDRFDPTRTLASLGTPKLMIYSAPNGNGLYHDQAAEPKQKANTLFREESYLPCLRSFLSKYLPGS